MGLPLWVWSLSMSYVAVLVLAAVWATVERTRVAIAGRTPAKISALDAAGAESMTARELEAAQGTAAAS
jgi:saccharopine dehydrogenase-like NADP-dependent oxidoreductase